MRDLILHPRKRCWGVRFQRLYPLTHECCNGCPVHSYNTYISDDMYKIRIPISYKKDPDGIKQPLSRVFRFHNWVIVRNAEYPRIDISKLAPLVTTVNQEGLSTLVGKESVINQLSFLGMKLTIPEFSVVTQQFPALLAGGLIAIFGEDDIENDQLFLAIERLKDTNYKVLMYCNDSMHIASVGRPITSFLDCKVRNSEDFT